MLITDNLGGDNLVEDDSPQIAYTVTCVEKDTPGYLENIYDNEEKI